MHRLPLSYRLPLVHRLRPLILVVASPVAGLSAIALGPACREMTTHATTRTAPTLVTRRQSADRNISCAERDDLEKKRRTAIALGQNP